MTKKITLNSLCLISICLYIFSILFWNYTIVYKAVIGLLLVLFAIKSIKKEIRFSPLVILYGIFTFFSFFRTIIGPNKDTMLSISYCFTLLLNLLIMFLISSLSNEKKDLLVFFKVFIFTSFLGAIYSFYVGDFTYAVPYLFFSNYSFSHNTIPIECCFSIGFLLYFYEKNKRKRNIFLILFFLIFILMSGARKALIFALLLIVCYFFLLISKRVKKDIYIILIPLCIGLFILLLYLTIKIPFLYNFIGYRFKGFIDGLITGNFKEGSSYSRSVMLRTAINLCKNSFWWGYGIFSFSTFEGSYGSWSHNNYLELIVSGGFIYCLLYLFIYINLFKRLKYVKDKSIKQLFIIFLIYFILIHDNLSVSYLSRDTLLILSLIDIYICFDYKEKNKEV